MSESISVVSSWLCQKASQLLGRFKVQWGAIIASLQLHSMDNPCTWYGIVRILLYCYSLPDSRTHELNAWN